MFDLDAFIANKDLILKDRDNRADVQKVLSVYAEKVDDDYVVKAKWSDIFVAMLQGMKVQAQVITLTEADEEEETDASAVVETYDLYDATVTANGFKVNGTDLSAAGADAYPVGSLSRPSSGGGGGGGGVLVCTADENGTLDHTWKEISEAPTAVLKSAAVPSVNYLTGVIGVGGNYIVVFSTVTEGNVTEALFSTDSEDDYPASQGGGVI